MTTFPTFDQFLAGLSRASGVPVAPPDKRPSGAVRPSALPADFLTWLDAEVERMHRAKTLRQPPPAAPMSVPPIRDYKHNAPALRPDQIEAVRVVERILDDNPDIAVRAACRQAARDTGHPWSTLVTWRQRAIDQGYIPTRAKRIFHPVSITYSDKQKATHTARLDERRLAAVMEVNDLLKQVPRPTVDDACRAVAPRYGVGWSTVHDWRKQAIRQARQPHDDKAA